MGQLATQTGLLSDAPFQKSALKALRIASRQRLCMERLYARDGMALLLQLAQLKGDAERACADLRVAKEAVMCLMNVLFDQRGNCDTFVSLNGHLGLVHALALSDPGPLSLSSSALMFLTTKAV